MEAIKPRQIINYDAGIVLIDLHQLNVKTASDKLKSTLNTGQPHLNKNRTAEQQPATSAFPNQMIEQINIALEQRVREFLSWVVKPAVGD